MGRSLGFTQSPTWDVHNASNPEVSAAWSNSHPRTRQRRGSSRSRDISLLVGEMIRTFVGRKPAILSAVRVRVSADTKCSHIGTPRSPACRPSVGRLSSLRRRQQAFALAGSRVPPLCFGTLETL